MASIKGLWRKATNNNEQEEPVEDQLPVEPATPATMLDLDIAGNDPLAIYLQSNPGVVEVNKLLIDSPAVRELRDSGARLVVPLVSQGELIGLINLGPRLSEQEYSADDRKLLNESRVPGGSSRSGGPIGPAATSRGQGTGTAGTRTPGCPG